MPRLTISLLGSFQVALAGQPLSGFASRKVQALLAYLAVEADRPHSREELAGLLWPNYSEASARATLRSVLANLRRILGDHQALPPFLEITIRATRKPTRFSGGMNGVRTFVLHYVPAACIISG
jgi:DNA-binding response OmpR family regulator